MYVSTWIFVSIIFTHVARISAQVYTGRLESRTSFPTDIPAATVEIDLFGNSISSFPEDAFDPFYQLTILDIGKNPFTQLPNLIPVGDTLTSLSMATCKLVEVNATVFSALVVLNYVSFRSCNLLVTIPDVPGPGPTGITFGLQAAIRILTFPSMTNYKTIKTINFRENRLQEITEADVQGMGSIDKLYLKDSTLLHTLPDAPLVMQTLTVLEIINTAVSVVPLMCTSTSLQLMATASSVSLCTCENVWLSALAGQRGSVSLDSMACGAATTTEQLLQQACSLPPLNNERIHMGTAERRYTDFFCAFPVHSYITGISKFECGGRAMSVLGCSSFGFRPTDDYGTGNCAIIAPTDTALTGIPDADTPGWFYYSLHW